MVTATCELTSTSFGTTVVINMKPDWPIRVVLPISLSLCAIGAIGAMFFEPGGPRIMMVIFVIFMLLLAVLKPIFNFITERKWLLRALEDILGAPATDQDPN